LTCTEKYFSALAHRPANTSHVIRQNNYAVTNLGNPPEAINPRLLIHNEHSISSSYDKLGTLISHDDLSSTLEHDEFSSIFGRDKLGSSTFGHVEYKSLFIPDEHDNMIADDPNGFSNRHHDAAFGDDDLDFFDLAAVDHMLQDLNQQGNDTVLSDDKTVEAISNTLKGLGPIDADVESMIEPFDSVVTSEDLKRPPSQFVHMFARIQAVGEGLREQREHPSGSGKMFWFIKCPNHDLGCEEEMIGPRKIQTHYIVLSIQRSLLQEGGAEV
jgi:hypothetical protein